MADLRTQAERAADVDASTIFIMTYKGKVEPARDLYGTLPAEQRDKLTAVARELLALAGEAS